MKWLLSLFFAPKPFEIARRELRNSKIHLMSVESDLEMMIAQKDLLTRRIARLENFMDDDIRAKSEVNWSNYPEVSNAI